MDSESSFTIPLLNRAARWLMRPSFRLLFHILFKVKITGEENIPSAGGYIIAHNHISYIEPPLILAFWPRASEAISAVEVYKRRGQSWLVRLYGAIPIDRQEMDRQSIQTMLRVVRAGKPLLIAPEGGRSHTPGLRRGLPGIAYIVNKAHVPVIPVGVIGSTSDALNKALKGKRPILEVRIGTPVTLPPLQEQHTNPESRHLLRQQNIDLVMQAIAALLPPDYRGEYSSFEEVPKVATA